MYITVQIRVAFKIGCISLEISTQLACLQTRLLRLQISNCNAMVVQFMIMMETDMFLSYNNFNILFFRRTSFRNCQGFAKCPRFGLSHKQQWPRNIFIPWWLHSKAFRHCTSMIDRKYRFLLMLTQFVFFYLHKYKTKIDYWHLYKIYIFVCQYGNQSWSNIIYGLNTYRFATVSFLTASYCFSEKTSSYFKKDLLKSKSNPILHSNTIFWFYLQKTNFAPSPP